MREKRSISVRAFVLILTVVVLVSGVAGGTLAFLMQKTDPIENTFSTADINITLTETKNTDTDNDGEVDSWSGKMVPGTDIDKDPKVTVVGGSEACWLFVKVEEDGGVVTVGDKTYSFSDFVKYSIADGWTKLENVDGVYYRKVAADDADQPFDVISDNEVSIPDTVTKDMLDAIEANTDEAPSLTFTAYAIQYEGFDDKTDAENAAAAWAEAQAL